MSSILGRSKDRAIIFPFIFRVFPAVERELFFWRAKASAIPDEELRKQALASISQKRFHCQGGSIYALYTPEMAPKLVRFIVALQTISDYLDNLCDRVPGAGERSFRTLHGAILAAVDTSAPICDWYRDYTHHDDGGYLDLLVRVSRETVSSLPGYADIRSEITHLMSLYSDLQVYKHMEQRQRVEMLVRWVARHADLAPGIFWWEFAAASGSTLGVFALAALAAAGRVNRLEADRLLSCYFPWVCGTHILLDYFIDLDEDREHGDLNFVSFYPSSPEAEKGLSRFIQQSLESVEKLPRPAFHRTVTVGLLALYLSDPKVFGPGRRKVAQQLLRYGGAEATWLHRVCMSLRKRGTV